MLLFHEASEPTFLLGEAYVLNYFDPLQLLLFCAFYGVRLQSSYIWSYNANLSVLFTALEFDFHRQPFECMHFFHLQSHSDLLNELRARHSSSFLRSFAAWPLTSSNWDPDTPNNPSSAIWILSSALMLFDLHWAGSHITFQVLFNLTESQGNWTPR